MSELGIILLTLGIIGAGIFLICLIAGIAMGDVEPKYFFLWKWYFQWRAFRRAMEEENAPCFTFEQIRAFYNTAPQKWKMGWDTSRWDKHYKRLWLRYRKTDAEKSYYHSGEYVFVGMKTLRDYLKVIRFFTAEQKYKEKYKDDLDKYRNTAEVLACFKRDADNAEAEAARVMKEQEQKLKDALAMLNSTNQVLGGH